jgi:hypothetical protein
MEQTPPVTAIDILLEPDATMVAHAKAANARLRAAFPQGFSLDASHQPHITMLQCFVRTLELERVYSLVEQVLAGERVGAWELTAFKYYYVAAPPLGGAGMVIQPTSDLLRLQRKLNRRRRPAHREDRDRRSFLHAAGRAGPPALDDTVHRNVHS